MTTYTVYAEEFFARAPGLLRTNYAADCAQCAPAVRGIIDRYGLAGKRILSVGARHGIEEHAFNEAGCDLTMNDIDEEIEAFLRDLKAAPPRAPGTLTYVIEDAGEYARHTRSLPFDAVYVSSFHPDERRREDIQSEFKERRTPEQAYHYVTWPAGTDPYHESMLACFRLATTGGLIISQHYRGGVYLDHNAFYIEDIQRQFARDGLTLLEIWCFRASPAHALVAAIKGDAAAAASKMEALRSRPPIRTFHGRYDNEAVRTDVVKVFEFGGNIDPSKAFVSPSRS